MQDEIFHIPQLVRYCEGDLHWDPKLTTPPGLYALTLALRHASRFVGIDWPCDSTNLARATNLLAVTILPWLCWLVLNAVHGAQTRPVYAHATGRKLAAYACATLPPLWFFGFLYYTDVLSVCAVLGMIAAATSNQHILASTLGIVSLFFRQNNIVWVVFAAGASSVKVFQQLSHVSCNRSPPLFSLIKQRFAWIRVASVVAPYLPAVAGFAVYVIWNDGSLVLGDKTHHEVAFHVPQLGYFFAFALAFGWPVLLRTPRWRVLDVLALITLTVAGVIVVIHFTIVHPFMLADNRHYVFYVWRRIINARSWTRYALVPVYAASALTWIKLLACRQSALWTIGFVTATALTLVPTPLIEPRYYLVPYLVLRLHVPEVSAVTAATEIAWNALINFVTILVFCRFPFTWTHETGQQRFMW